MLGRTPTLEHVVQFRVRADPVVADQQLCADAGMLRHHRFDQRNDRIRGAGDAEQYFAAPKIECESRSESLAMVILDAAKRAHQADGGRSSRDGRSACAFRCSRTAAMIRLTTWIMVAEMQKVAAVRIGAVIAAFLKKARDNVVNRYT